MTNQLTKIFLTLGLDAEKGLYITSEERWKSETSFPNRVNRLLKKKIKPDAFFCFDNKPLILFFENPANRKELHEAIWNFNECPIVIIVERDSVEIFNGFKYEIQRESLHKLGGINQLNDFSYFELVTGKTWEQYEEHLNYKNRVDYHLLQNIRTAREILLNGDEKRAKLVNAILGKVIFVRYLIDRKVKMKFDGRLRTWTNAEFCELLDHPNKVQEFFEYLEDEDRGFNGDLFPLTAGEYRLIRKNDYQVLKNLLLGQNIAKNQPSLFGLYDFSIIPIEFISNVYELFIGQENQQREGAYYTPLFLVDYILKETVERHLSDARELHTSTNSVERPSQNSICKVLDPACGSGVFLVETLRKIIETYIAETDIDPKSQRFKTVIKNLAQENIYGIDKDLSAVQVAVFSIYLTLLDYLEPPGIETFKFPVLLNTNFFHADFFDTEAEFNERLGKMDFAFVLGNPPWKGNGMDEVGLRYLKNRRNQERKLQKPFPAGINNNEIAEGFVLRVSDFCGSRTRVSFIVRSSSLYNLGYSGENFSTFRRYLLEEFFIDGVFELAPVRHEVFEKSNTPAIAPAAVIFYRYANGKNTDTNIVHHISLKYSRFFSLFKIFTISRNDYKTVPQKMFKSFDWLWKVLVYGSYLDFEFVRRLIEETTPIQDIIDNEKKFVVGTGIQYSSSPSYNSKHLLGKPFIDSYGITSFFIIPEKISKFNQSKVHRLRDERLFEAPMLLIREGIDMATLKAKCAISNNDLLFKGSITSVKALQMSDKDILEDILAIFNSSLFTYYSINLFTTIGIERERVTNYNKFNLPYIALRLKGSIDKIEQTKKQLYALQKEALVADHTVKELEGAIETELNKINDSIYQHLNMSEIELALIQYANEISLRLIVGSVDDRRSLFRCLSFNDPILEEYASVFLKRFKSSLEKETEKKFVIEIWHTRQIVGMFFKVVSSTKISKDIIWTDKQSNEWDMLSFIVGISSGKITDKLFVQKDIRGFEREYFYIFKPNEKRLWHKAIGHLDANEFADAMLKTGKK